MFGSRMDIPTAKLTELQNGPTTLGLRVGMTAERSAELQSRINAD